MKEEVSMPALCLKYVLLNEQIDNVVVKVDNLENLHEIIDIAKDKKGIESVKNDLDGLRDIIVQ